MKRDLLDELEDLLNIPQLERIIHHKVEELKIYLKDEIDHYMELKDLLRRSVFGKLTVVEPGIEPGGQERVFLFQLDKDANDRWGPPVLEPSPPPGYHIGDILPDRVVNQIVGDEFPLGEFQTVTGLALPGIEVAFFDLYFIKYSESHILGTVCRRDTPSTAVDEVHHYDPREAVDGNYNELILYMQKFPSLRIYFLTEFHMKMKPLINGNMVKLTSSIRPGDRF